MAKINTTFSFRDELSSGMNKMNVALNELNSTLKAMQGSMASGVNPKIKELGKDAADAADGVSKMTSGLLSVNAAMGIVSQMRGLYDSLSASIDNCVQMYQYQADQELKLSVIMKQRMNATEEDIQSIKDFASAQQSLGVYGDEIILQGAQELASFTSSAEAIKTLIPAMNNLIAQQYGYSASGQQFQSTADMMGKVLSGQVGALSRLGYIFSEEEKQMLKTGTEMERAATLAKIITDNVGEMNVALRNTAMGAMQDMNNTLGDMQEELGKALIPMQSMFRLSTGQWKISFYQKLIDGLNTLNRHPVLMSVLKGTATVAIAAIGTTIAVSLIPMLGAVITKLGIIAALKTAISGPLGLLTLGLGAAAGAFLLLNKEVVEYNRHTDDLCKMADKGRSVIDRYTDSFNNLSTAIKNNKNDMAKWYAEQETHISNKRMNEITQHLRRGTVSSETVSNSELLQYYLTQMKSVESTMNAYGSLKNKNWRGWTAEEMRNEIQGKESTTNLNDIMRYRAEYDKYFAEVERLTGELQAQTAELRRQEEIKARIAESEANARKLGEDIAGRYAQTEQGRREGELKELQRYRDLLNRGTYDVLRRNGDNGPVYTEQVALSREQMAQLRVIVAEMEKKFKTNGSGALKVSDENIVDISNDYRELLSQTAARRFNMKFNSVQPSINMGGVVFNKNGDIDEFVRIVSDKLEEQSGAYLYGEAS